MLWEDVIFVLSPVPRLSLISADTERSDPFFEFVYGRFLPYTLIISNRTEQVRLSSVQELSRESRAFTAKIYKVIANENSLYACISRDVILIVGSIFLAVV